MLAGSVIACLLMQAPAAPSSAAWTLELAEVPTALARASLKDGHFTWTVETPFARGKHREATVKVDALGKDAKGRVPEGLWFFHKPQVGCVKGFDEFSGREGELCLEADGRGKALGEKFSASWADDGVLERLSIRGVQWRRGEPGWVGKNPWEKGFEVSGSGSAYALEPDSRLINTRELLPRPTGRSKPKGDCLALAQAAVDAAPRAKELVLGLVVESGRAFPHAWVREKSSRAEEDPSVPEGARPERTYLTISPPTAAARVYLDLVSGRAKVVKR